MTRGWVAALVLVGAGWFAGTGWAGQLLVPDPYSTIQEAIDAAGTVDEVIVSLGRYVERIDFKNKAIVVRSTDPTNPAVVATTIIDGDLDGDPQTHEGMVVNFGGGEGAATVLSGFTITGGANDGDGGGIIGRYAEAVISYCDITDNWCRDAGGGIVYFDGEIIECRVWGNVGGFGGGLAYCDGSIVGCVIEQNESVHGGGGLWYCSGIIEDCDIRYNWTGGHGGGIIGSWGTIEYCRIVGNTAVQGGGVRDSHGVMVRCVIAGNEATDWGGGLGLCRGEILDCLISDNVAGTWGGGLSYCDGQISGCTIVFNEAVVGGGYHLGFYEGSLDNCILWGNSAAQGSAIGLLSGASLTVRYGDVEGGLLGAYVEAGSTLEWGEGNMGSDPLFVDPAGGDGDPQTWADNDYHLSGRSPCINAGDPDFVPEVGQVDIDGQGRVLYGRVDMGADEVAAIQADFDEDGDVDLEDVAAFVGAMNGPGQAAGNAAADLDGDGDCDVGDFVMLARWFSGAL